MQRRILTVLSLLAASTIASAHGIHGGDSATHTHHGMTPVLAVVGGAVVLAAIFHVLTARGR